MIFIHLFIKIIGVTDINLSLGSIKKLMTSLSVDSGNLVNLGKKNIPNFINMKIFCLHLFLYDISILFT